MRGKGCSPIARASGLTSRTQCKMGLRREIRCKGEGEGVGVREQTRVVDEAFSGRGREGQVARNSDGGVAVVG